MSLRTTPIGKNNPDKKQIVKNKIAITKIIFKSFEQSTIKIPIKDDKNEANIIAQNKASQLIHSI